MKRFDFRLERILKLKEQRQRQAELNQMHACAQLEAARAEVALLGALLAEAASALEQDVGQPVPPDMWLARYHHAIEIGRALEAAELRVDHATREVEQANARRAKIRTEVEALQHLERRQWQDHLEDTRRAEQATLDEMGLRRWHARQTTPVSRQAAEEGGSHA